MIGIIAGVSYNNVIGKNGKLPWHYPADLKWFKKTTLYSKVIMGENTWKSIGERPLVGRYNVVLSKTCEPTIETSWTEIKNQRFNETTIEFHNDLEEYLEAHIASEERKALVHSTALKEKIWIIGGAQIFQAAMPYVDVMYLTEIPERIEGETLSYFPKLDDTVWSLFFKHQNKEDPRLWHFGYRRIK